MILSHTPGFAWFTRLGCVGVASFFLPSILSLLPSFLPSFLPCFFPFYFPLGFGLARLLSARLGFARLGLARLHSAYSARFGLLGLDRLLLAWLRCASGFPSDFNLRTSVGGGYTQVSWILKQPGHGFGRRCEVHPHFCLELRIWYNNLPVLLKYSSIQLTRGFPLFFARWGFHWGLRISQYKSSASLRFRRPWKHTCSQSMHATSGILHPHCEMQGHPCPQPRE